MAWIEKRKRWRLRDIFNKRRVVVISDLGIWKEAAEACLIEYRKAKSAGMPIEPKVTTMSDIRAFLKAHTEGRDTTTGALPMAMENVIDMFLGKHGPSLKGGVSENRSSAYYGYKYILGVIKRAWTGRDSDSITKLDVRDLINKYGPIGSKLKYLAVISKCFNAIAEYNEEGILKPPIKIPPYNPASKWKSEMRPADKRARPDPRWLSQAEWHQFSPHLIARARAICDIALRRFLRRADIKKISHLSIKNGYIRGLQEKTGEDFSVPVLSDQPTKYNFTNFRRDFHNAQVAAGMDYPKGHPLRFSLRTLRRTGARWAYDKTKDLVGISKMLGHRKISTTIWYLGIDETNKQAIAQAVDTQAAAPKRPLSKSLQTSRGR